MRDIIARTEGYYSEFLMVCRQPFSWDYFRIARHPIRIAHSPILESKETRYNALLWDQRRG
jgi:hypothetical protein